MTKLIVAFRSFPNAPKIGTIEVTNCIRHALGMKLRGIHGRIVEFITIIIIIIIMIIIITIVTIIMLFSWRYNPSWLFFHSLIAGFSLLVFEVS